MSDYVKAAGVIDEATATERASRIASLFFPISDDRHSLLMQVVRNELRVLSMECGWQQEVIKELLKLNGSLANRSE